MDINKQRQGKYYFYCPNCKKSFVLAKLPPDTVVNLRDGFGTVINHYECSKCHNLDAGFMRMQHGDNQEICYIKHVIGMYKNIRGIRRI